RSIRTETGSAHAAATTRTSPGGDVDTTPTTECKAIRGDANQRGGTLRVNVIAASQQEIE
ncbi:hypothetical protein, partial [Burkholderia sp. BCC1970]|uniref:hypothetical protein n=1 Tax=Burkholderia sp. BCC1970 TaxID=2817437 RepID=UPI002ABD88B6